MNADRGFFKKVARFMFGERVESIVKPYGIAVDSKERMIVVDSAAASVHIFDPLKGKYRLIDQGRGFDFLSPIGVAVDVNDNIYVSDSIQGKVFVFNHRGRFQFAIEGLIRPTGLAIDNDDHILYVVDTVAHNIKIYDLRGTYIKTIGGRGNDEGEFNFPTDIFVAGKGDIYVIDSMNFRVQKFNNDGRFLMTIGSHGDGTGDMGRPKGVAVDPFGYIYVVDAIFDTVQIFDQEGDFLLNFGSTGSGPGEFWLPSGIYVDAKARIYVSDSYNKRVQIFEYLGAKDDVLKR
jgi:DNA-binding beta-propeller fold protein YncE